MRSLTAFRCLPLLLLGTLVACQSHDKVRVVVTNDMKIDLEVVFEPQFDTSRPRLENMRNLDIKQGMSKPVEIERGQWLIQVDSREMELPKTRRIDFSTGGKIVIDHWIIRYVPDRPAPAKEGDAQPGS